MIRAARTPLWTTAAVALLTAGCYQGSLATRVGPANGDWSVAKQQSVHNGEPAEFQFVVINVLTQRPEVAADYVHWRFGGRDEVTTVEADGKFRVRLPAGAAQSSEERMTVSATAFRTRGYQDMNAISGQLIRAANPNDVPDQRIASDSISVRRYQSVVRFDIDDANGPYDWDTAMLTLESPTGPMIVKRSRLDRSGFELIEDPDGKRTVVAYQPKASEIQATGTTRAVLLVQDVNGREHRFEQFIDTP